MKMEKISVVYSEGVESQREALNTKITNLSKDDIIYAKRLVMEAHERATPGSKVHEICKNLCSAFGEYPTD